MSGVHGDRIHRLDPACVARIAAGEVVERPASIVKELVENSLDAEAGTIDIAIDSNQGQITSISVIDNGTGMNPPDSRMAFVRHATSKIRDLPDIFTCGTLGFRGEALASIAAVSRVVLVTKEKGTGALAGTRVVIEGGRMIEDEETGCPDGTRIAVEHIFYNTPARKKFQKSLSTEISLITGIIERLAVTHPETSFQLTLNGKEKISVPGNGSLSDTIIHLFGMDVMRQLIATDSIHNGIGVTGYISVPELSRRNPYQMYLSVNHRAIYSRALNAAIRGAYGTLLPADRYPVIFLELSVPGTDVDINVHPTKKEVRFSREKEILEAVRKAVSDTLAAGVLIPEKGREVAKGDQGLKAGFRYLPTEPEGYGVGEPRLLGRITVDRQLRFTEAGFAQEGGKLPETEIIGQLGELYIIARTGTDDLLIIDQHAAHERILYEQLSDRSQSFEATQELIAPVVLHLSPREGQVLSAVLPILRDEGFVIEEFGGHEYAVRTVPIILGRNIDPGMVRDIIAELIIPGISSAPNQTEQLRRVIACRGAIKAGAACTRGQCEQLIRQLNRTRNPFTCPHGRPTMVVFPWKKLNEFFKRT
jgi:DNA mismatch repair protein MutL